MSKDEDTEEMAQVTESMQASQDLDLVEAKSCSAVETTSESCAHNDDCLYALDNANLSMGQESESNATEPDMSSPPQPDSAAILGDMHPAVDKLDMPNRSANTSTTSTKVNQSATCYSLPH
jgi:hypothetical protein